MHVGLALLGAAPRHLLFRGLQLIDADQLFLEGLRGARVVADLVAPVGIRHRDVFVAARELEQDFADAADRTGDRDGAEHGKASQNGDDEQADAEIEPVDERRFFVRLPLALLGRTHQGGGGRLGQRVHLGADRAGAVHQIDGVAIVLRRRGEFAGDGGIAFEQSGQPIQPFLIGRIVDDFHGGGDVCRRGRLVAIEFADGAVDLARRDREANFAGFELHAARMVGGAQCFVGGALLVVRVGALQRGAVFADLLIGRASRQPVRRRRLPKRRAWSE